MRYDYISYKQFNTWCNKRAADGCWSMKTAIYCLSLIDKINKVWFFRREKVWKENYEEFARSIVNEIQEKMECLGYKG